MRVYGELSGKGHFMQADHLTACPPEDVGCPIRLLVDPFGTLGHRWLGCGPSVSINLHLGWVVKLHDLHRTEIIYTVSHHLF